MIVIGNGPYKQCSSTPFCIIMTGLYSASSLSFGESKKKPKKLNNLAYVHPTNAYVLFSGVIPRLEALGCLKERYEFYFHYFDVSIPSYKRIKSLKNHLRECDWYPRARYDELSLIERKIGKGYVVTLCEKNNNNERRFFLVYNSLAAAQEARDKFYPYRYDPNQKYSLCSWYVYRVVVSLSSPIAIFGSYNGRSIGYWWCRLFSACLDESRKPESNSHIFFHYHLDPDKEEIRYEL